MGDGKWLNCRLSDIEERLDEQGHKVSIPVISRLLRERDYRLHVNVKEVAGQHEPIEMFSSNTSLSSARNIKLLDSLHSA
jgi:hypothetical protein